MTDEKWTVRVEVLNGHELVASARVPADPGRALGAFHAALSETMRPAEIVTLPAKMSKEEVEKVRAEWERKL